MRHLTLISALLLGAVGTAALAAQPARSARKGAASMVPVHLRCEYLVDPTAVEARAPRLSWRFDSPERGQRQTAMRVLVASSRERLDRDQGDLWDSGKVASDVSTGVAYGGRPLSSRQQAFWKVRAWDAAGKATPWSETAEWTAGLLKKGDWTADWISFRDTSPVHQSREKLHLPPARYYRKEFQAPRAVKRAVLYASALGLVELRLNGKPVSDEAFAPGWSDYKRRAYYRAYDVTKQLGRGANALGAVLADGWYSGYLGYGLLVGYGPYRTGRSFYGKTPALLAQLEIEYTDGSRQTVGTSPEWKTTDRTPVREADMLMGESYDARMELPGWDRAGFDASGWEPAVRAEENGSVKAPYADSAGQREIELGFVEPPVLQAYSGVPVRVTQTLKPVRKTQPAPGTYIFDMGQNFSGVVRLRVKGPAGTSVRLRFGEMLHPDGRLMTENLRRARATDTYVLRGDPNGEEWEPRFTYHGFQFVEVTGYPGEPGMDAVTGLVLHSDTPLTSSFECSDPMLNRFFQNVVWTQRANFFEVPTDCPQRDERLGWMGDAQVYARAATYHADVASFFTKWMDDVEESQLPNGAYPDYAPYPMFHGGPEGYGTAWTDAGVICTYTIHQVYGDHEIVRRHWDSMKKFLEFRARRSPDRRGVSKGNTWGDWLSLGETTPIELVDAAYFAYSAQLMARMAPHANGGKDLQRCRDLAEEVTERFQEDYVRADGTLKVDTQTAYVLALAFDLIPAHLRARSAARLAQKIEENGFRMATGFLGTRSLLPVLTATGHHDLAVRLMQSRQFPSWGYEVENGATSVWERWNSYTKEKGFGDAGMNSFSHYAFGAVSEWMFQSLAGIDTSGLGYKQLLLRPGPPAPGSNPDHEPVSWVKAEYDSLHGKIRSHWRRTPDAFELEVTVPANTTAVLHLPAVGAATVTEGGKPLHQVKEIRVGRELSDRIELRLGSGTYRFRSRL
ncbi:MAG: family 78 glycoside hydrolase catalytic domain [Armatimonadota bacterium]